MKLKDVPAMARHKVKSGKAHMHSGYHIYRLLPVVWIIIPGWGICFGRKFFLTFKL